VGVSHAGLSVARLGPGAHFGEIALLCDTSRTATVAATCVTRLITIDGRDFVDAVSSSEAAFAIGRDVSDELLSRDAAGGSTTPDNLST
jgi:CRP-like cAMP-binding protein